MRVWGVNIDKRKRMKIALLEDNPVNQEFMQTLLTMEGHQVFPFHDATSFLSDLAAAWHSAGALPYTFAILDLMLPGPLSGLDAIQRIWETYSPAARLPLIVISGAGRNLLQEVHARFPDVPVLRKPFRTHELLAAIDTLGIREEPSHTT
jgi:DNA-binding response OmpR family regulator